LAEACALVVGGEAPVSALVDAHEAFEDQHIVGDDVCPRFVQVDGKILKQPAYPADCWVGIDVAYHSHVVVFFRNAIRLLLYKPE